MSTHHAKTLFVCAVAIATLGADPAVCQTPAWPGSTPPAEAPGSPAGSYPLSDLETVDLYSGMVNFTVPIRNIGGRGSAGYRMTLPMQRGWTMTAVNDGGQTEYIPESQLTPDSVFGSLADPESKPYTPGLMAARQFGSNTTFNCGGGLKIPNMALTKMVFITSDGTETEFIDQQSGGQALRPNCSGPPWGASGELCL